MQMLALVFTFESYYPLSAALQKLVCLSSSQYVESECVFTHARTHMHIPFQAKNEDVMLLLVS